MVQLILWALLILFPVSVQATTYYVATTGNDANNGSEAAPWATVKKAVDTMVAGDTTYLRGGTFVETAEVRFARSGTASAPITLRAYPNETPIISFSDPSNGTHRVVIWNSSGANVAIGWIVIEGITFADCAVGVRFYSAHDVTVRNNAFRNNRYHGMLGNGIRILVDRNIFNHNGGFDTCSPIPGGCIREHGLYLQGSDITITNNLFYDNLAYGIVLNGSSSAVFNSAVHPSAEYANSYRWIIANNTFAYNRYRGGITVWGHLCNDARIENNIFYENSVSVSSAPQGIECTGCSLSTGIKIRNNHFYASGSGGTVAIESDFNADLVSTGNITNVSAPAFVNGGSNALPASPDFRLTASSPVNIARTNEFPNTATGVVGAFKTNPNPTCSITTNKMTCTVASVTPLQNISSAGVTIGCTGSACPGSPTASTTQKIAGTDAQLETVIAGIAGNACVATNQTWTKTYNAATGTWTGGDNIGPYPGLHQKLFSFTNLAVTNACTGSGPPTTPGTPYIEYLFLEGTGTTATNTGSFGASGNGTLSSGVTWVSGGGVSITGSTAQSVSLPYGSGQDMSAQDHTISFLVNIPSGGESLSRTVFGAPLDTAPVDERFYISTLSGTWRLGIQATNDGTASDLTVDAGPQHICVRADATANTVTLHKNGIASVSAGGVKAITPYAVPGNFQLGLLPGLTNGHTATYSHFELYRSLEDCNTLYQAAIAPPASSGGTFSQTAIQFEEVYTSGVSGTVRVLPSPSNAKKVIKNGAVALVAQVECNNCAATSFRLASRDNGMGDWLQVPNTETSGNTYMWGTSAPQFLNTGSLGTRVLENGCTVVTGSTQTTDAQIPSITLPSSGCTMLRYIIKVRSGASGYTEFRVEKEGGVAFAGSYALGRIEVTDMQAGGMGF